MGASLPRELKQFVRTKIKDGAYKNEDDLFKDAVRVLSEKDHLLQAIRTNRLKGFAILGSLAGADIDTLLLILFMQLARDANEDLREMMEEIKANQAARARLRELIKKVKRDVSRNVSRLRRDYKKALDLKAGMGSQKAYHQAPIPFADTDSPGGVRIIKTDLFPGEITEISQLITVKEDLEDQRDSLSELSEEQALRMQLILARWAKAQEAVSNLLKKLSETHSSIIQNFK